MSEPKPPLSVFIIAKNEAERIGATLAAVRPITDDLVVVDSGSTDGTQAIAESHGARVVENAWAGYGLQKRFAEDQCRHTWLLNVDADEVVPADLAREISALFARGGPSMDGYGIRITEIFPGEGRPHPFAYSLAPVRLYRKDRGRYVESPVHDRVAFQGSPRLGRLRGTIHHYSVRSLGDQIIKLNAYAEQQAVDLETRGVKLATIRILTELPLAFLKAYVGRRHFVRGVYGFMTAVNFAYFRWLRIAKHIERRRLAARRQGLP
jgi:glycosyltransferase involved in cell wall biosynthesis